MDSNGMDDKEEALLGNQKGRDIGFPDAHGFGVAHISCGQRGSGTGQWDALVHVALGFAFGSSIFIHFIEF